MKTAVTGVAFASAAAMASRYVVKIREGASTASAETLLGGNVANIGYRYDMPGFYGFSVELDEEARRELEENEDVEFVLESTRQYVLRSPVPAPQEEGDEELCGPWWDPQPCEEGESEPTPIEDPEPEPPLPEPTPDHPETTITQENPVWNLDRVDARVGYDKAYTYPKSAGAGVTCYVIDTGVDLDHPDFEGRARRGANFTVDEPGDADGHGTHVAATVAGKSYGIAKDCEIVDVKVVNDDGTSTEEIILAGINWVANDGKDKPSVANLSLGWNFKVPAADDAVTAAVRAGTLIAIAAGNSAGDACLLSPVSEQAIMVAASDEDDKRAIFSEHGPCVDLFAPGVNIESAEAHTDGSILMSGTSMAAPVVTGAAALLLGEDPSLSPGEVKAQLEDVATKGLIRDALESPNKLVYTAA